MVQWFLTFDSIFFLGLVGALCGGLGMTLRLVARMKCSNCRMCWGAIDVVRDVAAEEIADVERAAQAATQPPRRGSGETTILESSANSPRPSGGGYSAMSPSPVRPTVMLNRL